MGSTPTYTTTPKELRDLTEIHLQRATRSYHDESRKVVAALAIADYDQRIGLDPKKVSLSAQTDAHDNLILWKDLKTFVHERFPV